MARLLCFGDLHLGQGSDLARHPGDRLRDQADVLGRIAGLAVEHQVDGILCAGDVFEGPGITPEQLDIFARFVDACHHCDIPILSIVGNSRHDAAARETHGLQIYNHIDGVEVHAGPTWVEFAGCAVATLPWVSPASLVAQHGRHVSRDEINTVVADLLVEVARDLHDTIAAMPLSKRLPRVLLAHWSVSGSALPNGLPVDQLREPVLPLTELEQLGFDAIVLGHIHRRQVLDDEGRIFYVGSPLPLNFGEAAVEHGVWIVEPERHRADGSMQAEFVPVESRRLLTFDEHLSVHDRYGLTCAFKDCDVDGAIVRVRLHGSKDEFRTIADTEAIGRALAESGAHVVRVQPEIVREDRARVAGLDEQAGEQDALTAWLDAAGYAYGLGEADEAFVSELRDLASRYFEAVA